MYIVLSQINSKDNGYFRGIKKKTMKCASCQKPIKGRQAKYRIHPINNKLWKENFICGICYWKKEGKDT